MKSVKYRDIVRKIVLNRIGKDAPGLKKKYREQIAKDCAALIHGKLYGAHVDGVDSPLYQLADDAP